MDNERNNQPVLMSRASWRLVAPWFLALAVLSAIVFGPWGLLSYTAGLLKSMSLMLLFIFAGLVGWGALLLVACLSCVKGLRARRSMQAGFWSSIALGIMLAFALCLLKATPLPITCFADGVVARLGMEIDTEAVQAWVESLDPNDCLGDPHSGTGIQSRYLGKEEQPPVLKHQNGMVLLGLDAEGRPCVRLGWDESKAGMWGLVVGRKDMKTPPSEPGMYGEKRTRLRPGVYFWYEET